jgi:hypothetical protein
LIAAGRLQTDNSFALELTALQAKKDRVRARRMAVRWLKRWLEESGSPSVEGAGLVVASLAALGGRDHDHALWTSGTLPEERPGGRERNAYRELRT